jgi:hypothetical protein
VKKLLSILVVATFAVGVSACGGGSKAQRPRVEVDPSSLDVTIDQEYTFSIVNTGEALLTVTAAPTIASTPCAGDAEGVEPFAIAVTNVAQFPVKVDPRGMPGMGPDDLSAVGVTVTYTPQPVSCERTATVSILTNDPDRPTLTMTIRVAKALPFIEANPAILDLGYVEEGQSTDGVLFLQNSGLGDLVIDKLSFAGDAGFSFKWGCERVDDQSNETSIVITPQGQEIGVAQCEPIVLARNSSFQVPVRYVASHGEKANALLTVFSNDPRFDAASGKGLDVELRANWGGPCVKLVPNPLDFGSVVVLKPKPLKVRIESCGDEPVDITDIYLSTDSSDDFVLGNVPALNAANPLTLQPGASAEFLVTFVPQEVQTDPDGKPVPDLGKVIVENSSPRAMAELPLSGYGVEAQCAVCEFEVLVAGKVLPEGDTVVPQTLLQFKDRSYDPLGGNIANWSWTALQPPGSQQIFDPSNAWKDPKFQPNVAGTYTFILSVQNEDGCRAECERVIEVLPPQGLHVELTWTTPQDPDETDQCWEQNDCGSDMDLHVVHPLAGSGGGYRLDATGEVMGYFDPIYDCNWTNKQPQWRNPPIEDPRYMPNLDLDDTDGAGPENFTLTFPEPDKCYRVGVHYYDEHDWGASYPTIRVYCDSTEVYNLRLTKAMYEWDMWDVGRVCCDDTANPFQPFKKTNGDPVIHDNYDPLDP